MEAWKLGCKGITVYITGSRRRLSSRQGDHASQAGRGGGKANPIAEAAVSQPAFWKDAKKPRPRILKGYTYSIETPLGKAFITINENGGDQPFEVFINTAKAGSENCRALRSARAPDFLCFANRVVYRAKRALESGHGAAGWHRRRQVFGFWSKSRPLTADGIAKALDEYLFQQHWEKEEEPEPPQGEPLPFSMIKRSPTNRRTLPRVRSGHPDFEEGCRKCYTCGHSEC
jgi:ribonucleoside-diphosphate reductase alpha chain